MPGDRNIHKKSSDNNKGNSNFKWLRKLCICGQTESYSANEAVLSIEETNDIKSQWEMIGKNVHQHESYKRQYLIQTAREMARISTHEGENWEVLKKDLIERLSNFSVDTEVASRDLDTWKQIGTLQRTNPEAFTDAQKKELAKHLLKQEGLQKGLGPDNNFKKKI